MKLFSTVVGFLLVVLLVTAAYADISLTLRNKPYLPPPIQEVPITNTHENTQQQQQQQQQTFKETNYGNARYHVFEVHNHYEPPTGNGKSIQSPASVETNYINSEARTDLTPKTEEIRIEHINAPSDFPLDDPSLDASYLGLTGKGESEQEIIVKHEFKSEKTTANNIPIPFPSNYRHYFPEKSHKKLEEENLVENSDLQYQSQQQSHEQYSQQQQIVSQFKPPPAVQEHTRQPQQSSITTQTQVHKSTQKLRHKQEYLPPIPAKSFTRDNQHGSTQKTVFSSSQQALLGSQQNFAKNAPFKGADYLPPHQHQQQGAKQSQQNFGQYQQKQQELTQNAPFKGPDYLPPHQKEQHQQGTSQSQQNLDDNDTFKGPDYLPPHQHQHNQQQQGAQQTQQNLAQSTVFKGPDYLPPHHYKQHQYGALQSPQNLAKNVPFKGPDYLPPHQYQQHQEGAIQSQKNFPQNAPFEGPAYLPAYQSQQHVPQTQQNISPNAPFKGPDYLPPYPQAQQSITQTNSQSYVPEYFQYQKQQNQVFRSSASYKGPDYLPPHQVQQTLSTPFKGPDYLPPRQQQQKETQFQLNNAFKGPDYLPPHQESRNNNGPFKGPDYLPPMQQQRNQQQPAQIQQSENLPLGYDFQKPANAEQAIAELHTLSDAPSRPQEVKVQTQIQVSGREQSSDIVYESSKDVVAPHDAETYKAPAYLPPGYISTKPENSERAIKQLHSQVGQTSNQLQSSQVVQQSNEELSSLVSSVPADYDFQKPDNAEHAMTQLHGQQNSYQSIQLNQIGQTGQNYEGQAVQNYQQSKNIQPSQSYQNQGYQVAPQRTYSIVPSKETYFQQVIQQLFKAPDYLPPVTEAQIFKGPDYLPPKITATQALISTTGSQTFKGPDYLPPNSGSKIFKGPDYLPPTATGSQFFKGPDYLPPKVSSQPIASKNLQQSLQVFKGPDYLPPVAGEQRSQFKGPDYLPPPTLATIAQGFQPTVMYPLSAFMTNVKPNDRYAHERKPFPEYGLPPATTITQASSINVSPMFSEPASRPQYYAPAMSYTTYTTKNQKQGFSALSRQTQETLQTFMPQEIRQQPVSNALPVQNTLTSTQTAVPVTKSTSSKIRTVQIVNHNAVKTLKVLESFDDAGVKTIKILGPSLEVPMGEHRIVKVVGGGHEQNVQTVKIFNDHQDATPSAVQQQSQSNAYLPVRQKRNPLRKSKVKNQGSK